MDTVLPFDNEHHIPDQGYIYDALPQGAFFRYLALEPGSDDEPLRCSIHTSAIEDAGYEAISYVWGSEVRDHEIFCNGRTIWITANLFQALKTLRKPNKVRSLWADSVCIDQDNDIEKGHQVSFMSEIYRSALRVIIFIGSDPNEHARKVTSLLHDVNDMLMSETGKLWSLEWDSFPDLHKHTTLPLLHDSRWESYAALLEQQWFKRGWVVREAGLATEALVIWGNSQFPWPFLMRTACWIQGKQVHIPELVARSEYSFPHISIHLDIYGGFNLRQVCIFFDEDVWVPNRLLDYLARGRYIQFKDRRDSIYAFFDLPSESTKQPRLVADYTQSPQEIFKSFAIQYLHTTSDVTLLNYVIHDSESLHCELPSWVPRWNEITQEDDDIFWLSAMTSLQESENFSKPQVIDESILRVKGVILDKVHFVSKDPINRTTTPKDISALWRHVQKSTPWAAQLEDFIDTLLFNRDVLQHNQTAPDQSDLDISAEGMASFVDAAGYIDWPEELDLASKFRLLHRSMQVFANAKRFMVTEGGHVGLAPAAARKGDVCVRMSGSMNQSSRFIYLLRGTDQALHYRFIGPAWIPRDVAEESHQVKGKRLLLSRMLSSVRSQRNLSKEQDIYLC